MCRNIFSPSVSEQETFNTLYKAQQWEDLARAIIKSKPYHVDLIWFYLGEASKGLGKPDVAATYYRNAVAEANSSTRNARCASVKPFGKDLCYGLSFPADAQAKLEGGGGDAGGAAPAVAGGVALPGLSSPNSQTVSKTDAAVDWRISDISLADTAQVATQKIKKAFPKIQSRVENRAQFVAGQTKTALPIIPLGTRFVAGFAELRGVVGKAPVAGLKELGNQSMSFDVIYSFTDPTKILLISRTQTFAHLGKFDDSPTSGTMKASLIEKYGNPGFIQVQQQRPVDLSGGSNPDPFNLVTMMWFSGNTAKRNERDNSPGNQYVCSTLATEIDTDGEPQQSTIKKIYESGFCGTVVIYRFSVYAGDRVGDATAMLFNGERIIDDYNLYAKNAMNGAKAQDQKDIDRRNAIKPVL
jgi:hypothetical protein